MKKVMRIFSLMLLSAGLLLAVSCSQGSASPYSDDGNAVRAAADLATAETLAHDWLAGQQDLLDGFALEGMVDSFEDYWSVDNPRQICYTYDQAVAAIAFISYGDIGRAELILGKMADIQAPEGFWLNSYWWNGYGEEIRKHVGPVLWMAIAVMNYEKATGNTSFHEMGVKAIDWCLTYERASGGITGGETQWAVPNTWTLEPWICTEHNIDAWPVLLYFADTTPAKATRYRSAAAGVKTFLDTVAWDSVNKRFYGGYKTDGNYIDLNVPMDVNPWGVLALGSETYGEAIWYVENASGNPGTLANPRYKHSLAYNGDTITAYDFDWQSDGAAAPDKDGGGVYGADIWFEGSSFMSLAWYLLGETGKADDVIANLIKKQGAEGSKAGGLPYCMNGTNNNYWRMAQENCVASTGWIILAINRWNPFAGGVINNDEPGTVAAPAFSPAGGEFDEAVTVTITSATSGAAIYYTTDGSVPDSGDTLYSGSMVVSVDTILKAIAVKSGMTDSSVTTADYVINDPLPLVATPTVSPAAGTYTGSVAVTLSCATAGAEVYYAFETAGVTGSYSLYTGPVTVAATKTLKAYATKSGYNPSSTLSALYTIVPVGDFTWGAEAVNGTPVIWFAPNAGSTWVDVHYAVNYGGQQNFRMTWNSARSRFEQTAAALKSGDRLDLFFTYNKGNLAYDSARLWTIYEGIVVEKTATPVLSPAGGSYTSPVSVTITCATAGAVIRYTTDGSVPTEASPLYAGALTVSASISLKARAFAPGMDPSDTVSADYLFSTGDPLMIDDFGSSLQWNQGRNDLGGAITLNGGIYNLEGDSNLYFFFNGGSAAQGFTNRIDRSLSGYGTLVLVIKGGSGGEESLVELVLNDGTDHVVRLSAYGTLTTAYKTLSIPLSAFGANLASVKTLTLRGTGSAKTLRIDSMEIR
jgi:hypothetical protein